MPIAVSTSKPEHFDLKSCPGGFVDIRVMTHGERMTRQGLLDKMKMSTTKKSRDVQVELDIMNSKVTMWEWRELIADHNLEYLKDPNDPSSVAKLDFSNPDHVRMVDSKVSEEINTYIGDVNNFDPDGDEEGEQGNS